MRQLLLDFPLPPKEETLSVINEIEISYKPRGVRPNRSINDAKDVVEILRPFIGYRFDQEKFWIVPVGARGHAKGVFLATLGTATSTLVQPREVYRVAITTGATALFVGHNHPSGDPQPSSADLRMTRILREAGQTLELPLLDHVILGSPEMDPLGLGFFSFRSAGHL